MKLVSTATVAQAIGFEAGVQEDVIGGAVDAATLELAGLLRTQFDRAIVTDTFNILPTGSIPLGSVYRTRLALSRGFITGPVVFSWGSTLDELAVSPIELGAGYVSVDLEKGGVVITGPDLRNRFIRCSYTAGFATGPEDDSDEAIELPDWLSAVAVLAAIKTLDTTAPSLRHDDKTRPDTKSMLNQIMSAIESKIRYFPSATYPIG